METSILNQLTLFGNNCNKLSDENFATVYYFSDSKIGLIHWKINPNFEQFKSAFTQLLDLQKNKPVNYFVSDIIKLGISTHEKRKWYRETAIPQAVKGGLLKAAIIVNNNPVQLFFMNLAQQLSKNYGLPLKVFRDVKVAKEWLFQNNWK